LILTQKRDKIRMIFQKFQTKKRKKKNDNNFAGKKLKNKDKKRSFGRVREKYFIIMRDNLDSFIILNHMMLYITVI